MQKVSPQFWSSRYKSWRPENSHLALIQMTFYHKPEHSVVLTRHFSEDQNQNQTRLNRLRAASISSAPPLARAGTVWLDYCLMVREFPTRMNHHSLFITLMANHCTLLMSVLFFDIMLLCYPDCVSIWQECSYEDMTFGESLDTLILLKQTMKSTDSLREWLHPYVLSAIPNRKVDFQQHNAPYEMGKILLE